MWIIAWRVMFALSLALAVFAAFEGRSIPNERAVLFGAATVGERGPAQWVLSKVPPDSPAGREGIKAGDILTLDDSYMRYRFRHPGDRLSFVVNRNGFERRVDLRVAAVPTHPDLGDQITVLLRLLAQVCMIGVALLLALRRSDVAAARELALFLVLFAFTLSFDPFRHTPVIGVIGHFAVNFAVAVSLMQVMRFAATFTEEDPHHIRRWIYRIAPYFCAFMIVDISFLLGQQYFRNWTEPALLSIWWACWFAALVTTLVAITIALTSTEGKDRHRLVYVVSAFFIGFSGPIVAAWYLGVLHVPPDSAAYASIVLWRLTAIAIPIGFGYAVMHDHVLDIGFALNRALLYGVVSGMIVPLFAVVKFFSDKMANAGHATGSVIMTVLALFLVSSLQTVQKRVQDVLDKLFFKERKKKEKALKQFAKEAGSIKDISTVQQRAVACIDKNAESKGCAIYLLNDDHRFELSVSTFEVPPPLTLEEDDGDMVKLRADQESIYLKDDSKLIPLALLVPMFIHHRLIGFVACGPKGVDSRYAPDEQKVLEDVAGAIGGAIDSLKTKKLETENAVLRQRLDALLDLVAKRANESEPATPAT